MALRTAAWIFRVARRRGDRSRASAGAHAFASLGKSVRGVGTAGSRRCDRGRSRAGSRRAIGGEARTGQLDAAAPATASSPTTGGWLLVRSRAPRYKIEPLKTAPGGCPARAQVRVLIRFIAFVGKDISPRDASARDTFLCISAGSASGSLRIDATAGHADPPRTSCRRRRANPS